TAQAAMTRRLQSRAQTLPASWLRYLPWNNALLVRLDGSGNIRASHALSPRARQPEDAEKSAGRARARNICGRLTLIPCQAGVRAMPVLKVLELMSESNESWEDAAQQAVSKASQTLKGIRSVWIKDFSATVTEDGKVETFRV